MLKALKDTQKLKELQPLLIEVREAQIEFDKDMKEDNNTKGSLDRLEYALSDLQEWIANNIKGRKTNGKKK